jgi:hypothetical protein
MRALKTARFHQMHPSSSGHVFRAREEGPCNQKARPDEMLRGGRNVKHPSSDYAAYQPGAADAVRGSADDGIAVDRQADAGRKLKAHVDRSLSDDLRPLHCGHAANQGCAAVGQLRSSRPLFKRCQAGSVMTEPPKGRADVPRILTAAPMPSAGEHSGIQSKVGLRARPVLTSGTSARRLFLRRGP